MVKHDQVVFEYMWSLNTGGSKTRFHTIFNLASYPGSRIKGVGGKESLGHTVCACVKLCTRLAHAMTLYDVLVTFDRVLTSALIDF